MTQDDNKEGIKGMANPGRYGIERINLSVNAFNWIRIIGLLYCTYLRNK